MSEQSDGGPETRTAPTGTATDSAAPHPPPPAGPRPPVSRQVRDAQRYQLLGEHGRGGLGRVSRARDVDLGRDVAIKELISRNVIGELRFMREALITARLEHPGIVPVYEAGCWDDGTPFYAMKLVSGQSLRALIAARDTVVARLGLLHHVTAVANAMAYAHRRHVIHRDLKPSNVIVGELGETVVIDWGLAKDLSAVDDAEARLDPGASPSASPDLTQAGSVMGTPAYMSPEQERGEAVDQRADVYAIGAMLWQLCSLERQPPRDRRHRHRELRRDGIDRDLTAILDKALATDPAERYADASGLAADLRSFQSGARIAARDYSFAALLAHWARRHRALAAAVAALVGLALGGGALYVRNVTAARDRVDAANGELVLGQAELLLRTGDPTAAAAQLARYHGADGVRRDRMAAEARGRGIARQALSPHAGEIMFLYGAPDGDLISLGADRALMWHHGGRSQVLARDASAPPANDYAALTHRLAYVSTPPGIVVLDVSTRAIQRIDSGPQQVVAFDASGTRLAAIDVHAVVTVWSLDGPATVIYRTQVPTAKWTWFGAGTQLVAASESEIWTVDIARPDEAPRLLDIRPASAEARLDRVVVGDRRGTLGVYDAAFVRRAELAACKGQVLSAGWIADTDVIMYGCSETGAALARWDAAAGTLTRIEAFATKGWPQLRSNAAGRYVAIYDETGAIAVFDRDTGVRQALEGLPGRPTFVALTDEARPRVVAGDIYGHVWSWDVPAHASRRLNAPTDLPTAATFAGFVDDATVAVMQRSRLSLVSTAGRLVRDAIDPGLIAMSRFVVAPDRRSLVTMGRDDALAVVPIAGAAPIARYVHGGPVTAAAFAGAGVVSSGPDGRLLAWAPGAAAPRELLRAVGDGAPRPLTDLVTAGDHAVVVDGAGAVTDVAPTGEARVVIAGGAAPRGLRVAADGRAVAVALDGAIAVYDASTWRELRRYAVPGGVEDLAIAPDHRSVLVIQPDRQVRLFSDDPAAWSELAVGALTAAFSPDGQVIALGCRHGVEWLYARRDQRWVYLRAHDVDLVTESFSPDGRSLLGMDTRGGVVVHDVPALFAEAALPDRVGG